MAAHSKKRIRVANEGQVFDVELNDTDDEDETRLLAEENALFRWSHKSTTLLIKTRLQLDAEFQEPTNKKTRLWQKVSNVMKANNFNVEGNRCDDKWRNLMQTYRKIKYRPTGLATTWEFFHLLDRGLAAAELRRPHSTPSFQRRSYRTKPAGVRPEFSQFSSDSSCEDDDTHLMDLEFGSSGSTDAASNGTCHRVQSSKDNDSEFRGGPPHWVNMVLERLEHRDKIMEQRENERWKKLMGAVELLHSVEVEKVEVLNRLTGMLEKYLDKQ